MAIIKLDTVILSQVMWITTPAKLSGSPTKTFICHRWQCKLQRFIEVSTLFEMSVMSVDGLEVSRGSRHYFDVDLCDASVMPNQSISIRQRDAFSQLP